MTPVTTDLLVAFAMVIAGQVQRVPGIEVKATITRGVWTQPSHGSDILAGQIIAILDGIAVLSGTALH